MKSTGFQREKILHAISNGSNQVLVNRSDTRDGIGQEHRDVVHLSDSDEHFLLDGGGFVLMRLLTLMQLPGVFNTTFMDIEGNLESDRLNSL